MNLLGICQSSVHLNQAFGTVTCSKSAKTCFDTKHTNIATTCHFYTHFSLPLDLILCSFCKYFMGVLINFCHCPAVSAVIYISCTLWLFCLCIESETLPLIQVLALDLEIRIKLQFHFSAFISILCVLLRS